jgi:hypothetical protein
MCAGASVFVPGMSPDGELTADPVSAGGGWRVGVKCWLLCAAKKNVVEARRRCGRHHREQARRRTPRRCHTPSHCRTGCKARISRNHVCSPVSVAVSVSPHPSVVRRSSFFSATTRFR